MKIYLLQRVCQVRILLKFSDIVQIQGKSECLTEKIVSDKKEMTENIYDRSEIEFASVEDPLNVHTTASNETTLVSVNSKHFYIFFLRVNLTIMVLEIF